MPTAREARGVPGRVTRHPGKGRIPFQVLLTKDLERRLATTAKRLGLSRGDVMCELVAHFAEKVRLRGEGAETAPHPGQTSRHAHLTTGKQTLRFSFCLRPELETLHQAAAERLEVTRGEVIRELLSQYADKLKVS